ncbi:MAG: hypothetical protein K2M45_10040 [Muribaculaceae bacterium]|nr:hypothetical protein [Muribaculaceae bacterium]
MGFLLILTVGLDALKAPRTSLRLTGASSPLANPYGFVNRNHEPTGTSLVDSRENEDSTIAQDAMFRHHIANLRRRVSEYKKSIMKDY